MCVEFHLSICFVTGCPVRREKYWTCCYQTESATEGDLLQIIFGLFFIFYFFIYSLIIAFFDCFQILESKEIETLVAEIEKEKEEEAEKKKQKKSTWSS